jgi:hypothetical protein
MRQMPVEEQQPEQIIGSGLGSLASGQFKMTYGQQRAPPVAAPAPAMPAGMPAGMSMQAIPPATMRGMPPMQVPVPAPAPAPAPAEPAYSAGLGALSSGAFPMAYGAKPEEQPQPIIVEELPLKKGKKKKKGKSIKKETVIIIPPQPPAPSNSPSFSAFNEVFGDRGLHL